MSLGVGVCVCVFFPFILDIKFVGRTSRGHTGGRSHRISHPPSGCYLLPGIIIIISAHKSDLSNPWSQTQASLSIPSLHPKKQIKEEKGRKKITDEKASPDLIGGEGGKNKQEQKTKSKDPPRISEKQIKKQARQTKCHTTVDTVRESAKHTPPVIGGGSGQSSVETKEHQYSNAKKHPLLFCNN